MSSFYVTKAWTTIAAVSLVRYFQILENTQTFKQSSNDIYLKITNILTCIIYVHLLLPSEFSFTSFFKVLMNSFFLILFSKIF